MKITRLTSLVSLLLVGTTMSLAQDKTSDNLPMMEITANVKTYYLDRMGFAPDETLKSALETMTRNFGGMSYNDYTILVNGIECHESNILTLTRISQVERIEVITDNRDGITVSSLGNLNIILRTPEEGTHGNASFHINTHASYSPSASLTHKKGNLTLWASASADMEDRDNDRSIYIDRIGYGNSSYYGYGSASSYYDGEPKSSSSNVNNRTFTADFGLQYKNDKHTLKFRLSEHYNRNTMEENVEDVRPIWNYGSSAISFNKYDVAIHEMGNKPNTLFSEISYQNLINDKTSFTTVLSANYLRNSYYANTYYGYIETKYENILDLYNSFDKIKKLGSDNVEGISGHKYMYDCFAYDYSGISTRLNSFFDMKPTDDLALKAGLNMTWSHRKDENNRYAKEQKYDQYNIAPYLFFDYSLNNKWALNVGERIAYRKDSHNSIGYPGTEIDIKPVTMDFSGDKLFSITNASLSFKPCDKHELMLAYKQNKSYATRLYPENSTTSGSLNPYTVFYEMTTTTKKIDLTYSFTGSHFNASVDATMGKINLGEDIAYRIFSNNPNYHSSDKNINDATDFFGLSASAVGTFGRFGISTDVCFYMTDKDTSDESETDKFLDIRLSPVYNFPLGIKASATVTYSYNKNNVAYEYDDKENWWYTLRVAKQWNNLEAYMKWENNLNNRLQVNETRLMMELITISTYSYEKHLNQVTFGLSYRF